MYITLQLAILKDARETLLVPHIADLPHALVPSTERSRTLSLSYFRKIQTPAHKLCPFLQKSNSVRDENPMHSRSETSGTEIEPILTSLSIIASYSYSKGLL